MSQFVNPWALPAPKAREVDVVVADPAQPGVAIPIRLRQLFVPESLAAQDAAVEFAAEFIDGIDGGEPNAYVVGDEVVPRRILSYTLVLNLYSLVKMEVVPEGGRRLGFDGFLGIALRMPLGYQRMAERALALNRGRMQVLDSAEETEEYEGNAPGAGAGNGAAKRSGSTSSAPSLPVRESTPA